MVPPPILASPSPYLQDAWVRWANRGTLTRRDVELVLGGFQAKSRVLEKLRQKIQEHRREDLSQLTAADEDASKRWDERLNRLGQWIASTETLAQTSNELLSWRETAQWFDRAESISRQFGGTLERRIDSMETRLAFLGERLRQWMDRLSLQEIELREIIAQQSDVTSGILVSSARKRAYLDFIFMEKEEEGRISVDFRKTSADVRQAMQRLARPAAWVLQKATFYPAYVEIRKNQVFERWRPLQQKLDALSEEALHLGLSFEEGRKSLRGIYEGIQRMRIIQEPFAPPRPFLHRLFNIKDD